MSEVRLLVGTRKGAFILTADGKRQSWKIEGPHFAGWEIYHLKGSLADPNRIYASQTSGWFGQQVQRSDHGGKTWNPVGNEFTQGAILGATEAAYPMLRGAIRDPTTKQRRPFVSFFACEEDLSHEPADALVPEKVASSEEPYFIVGAMAGG